MLEKWTTLDWHEFPMVMLSGLITYGAILLYTRIVGLRSFSKMSAADFAMTVAVGSLFAATTSTASPTLFLGLVALASLFSGQWLIAALREKSDRFSRIIDNEPLLLMNGSTILEGNLRRANVTRSDLHGKLREANVLNYDQVVAVVFETTGDVSVLHSADENPDFDPRLLESVVGAEVLRD